MKIRLAQSEDRDKWDEFIKDQLGVSPYHSFSWMMAVEKAYNHKGYYFIAEQNGLIQGVLPLVYLKPPLLQGQLVSLPFCDVGGCITEDPQVKKELILEAVSLAKKLNVKQIELREQAIQTYPDEMQSSFYGISHKVRMLLELPASSDELWDSFKSKLRSQIRKAEKNSLKFILGGAEQINDFYYIFCRNMKDLGSPVHAKAWFEAILSCYGKNVKMGLVYIGDTPVGTGIIISVGDKVSIPWASTLREYNRLGPNMLLYWNLLKYAADNGFSQFDFGRSTPEEGTYKFKSQWGAKPFPLYWNYLLMNGKQPEKASASSGQKEKLIKIWQKLPLAAANIIGPSIRKYISL